LLNVLQSSYGGPYDHPPIIGFAADGYILYGRYTANTQDGQEEDLDDCGGHAHLGFAYHYHPSVQEDMTSVEAGTTLGENFTSYWVAPKYCFKGNVTAQPNFWTATGSQVSVFPRFLDTKVLLRLRERARAVLSGITTVRLTTTLLPMPRTLGEGFNLIAS
jgi:hypothetical protein